MVLEHLFPESLLERKHWMGFILAVIYSTIAIVISRLLFAGNSGIVSVIFVSIFLIPSFQRLLRTEQQQEIKEKKQSFLRLLLDNRDMIGIYFSIFVGIYLTYMAYSFLGPFLGYDISSVFREQLSLESLRGGFVFSTGTFIDILMNNWWVLLATFLIALVAGDGAIFFVAWNASTWGTIFGYRAVAASMVTPQSALWLLLLIVIITLPHFLLEGGAYILAAIAGGVLSDSVDEREEIQRFMLYLVMAALLFIVLYWLIRALAPGAIGSLVVIAVALGLLWALQFVFANKHDLLLFRYNYKLFLFAIGLFALGAIVETLVLYNSGTLQSIYGAAMAYGLG